MISRLLTLTAWSMTPPAVWSPFHLAFMLIGIPLAAFAAWKLRTRSEAFRLHLLFACGVFLALSEDDSVTMDFTLLFLFTESRYGTPAGT